ncbi:MAG: DNA polymerase Y family protein [Pseudomonadota bacterium]
MPNRRILSLWFPRLGAERLLRREGFGPDTPLAVVQEVSNAQLLSSLSHGAETAGLRPGQPLRDARAMCPDLLTRPHDPQGSTATLAALRRWAGRYSPWVAEEAPESLIVDLTGCAHLFGGEAALLEQVAQDCGDLGLSVRAGIADTLGAAWALARYAGRSAQGTRSGDAIDQEARATRSRAAKRPGRAPPPPPQGGRPDPAGRIAPVGQTRQALAPLPVAALRLSPEDAAGLSKLGVRLIGDLAGLPRAALTRRFGRSVVRRLDQAVGLEPEPVSPAKPPPRFALRLTLPDPIGLQEDVAAGIDRLLTPLCARLERARLGARQVRLQAMRCDHRTETAEVSLTRPSADPDRIRPLLMLKLDTLDAGPGIDALRLEVMRTEPVHARQHKGHFDAAAQAGSSRGSALDDLTGRLGARIGSERITRRRPAESHIPEKTAQILAAAWSEPVSGWPAPTAPRPLLLWPPEPVRCADPPGRPTRFRWRRQDLSCAAARGPERIAPEWWLDDPAWRSGTRDYWDVTTENGMRLWLFYAHGHEMPGGWFCQGRFA